MALQMEALKPPRLIPSASTAISGTFRACFSSNLAIRCCLTVFFDEEVEDYADRLLVYLMPTLHRRRAGRVLGRIAKTSVPLRPLGRCAVSDVSFDPDPPA